VEVLKHDSKEASVGEVAATEVALVKSIFQAHGTDVAGGSARRSGEIGRWASSQASRCRGGEAADDAVRGAESAEAQGPAVIFRTQDLLVRQRT
jgi:hypothetical protein